jgi:ribosomal-protein-serine acetyltransferase
MLPERVPTRRFVLRRFNRRDADALTAAVRASLPELQLWLPWAHAGYDRDDAAAYVRDSVASWREGRAYDFAIRPHDDPELHLGNVSIWHVSRLGRSAEIGYWVRSDQTGQGVGTEVTAALVQAGFERMGLHKVILRIAVGNESSERIADKLGFTREGVLREELMIRGAWVDHTIYSLLEHEWRTTRPLDARI